MLNTLNQFSVGMERQREETIPLRPAKLFLEHLRTYVVCIVCMYVRMYALTGSSQRPQLLHKLLGFKCLVQSLYLQAPCLTWDSAVHGLMHPCNLEHILVGN